MGSNSFIEIEHKFVVGAEFDREAFLKKVAKLTPDRQAVANVRDTYFVLAHDNTHVFRHRFDNEIQQLTAKSVEDDAAIRTEINIPIDQSKGDQGPAILEFMRVLGCRWSGNLAKEIHVAYFHDCEIVFYRAFNQGRQVYCIEFEAVDPVSIEEGFRVLSKYETALGFELEARESRSLFELLLLDSAPDNIKQMFA
jgi:adenylate cyclase class IV